MRRPKTLVARKQRAVNFPRLPRALVPPHIPATIPLFLEKGGQLAPASGGRTRDGPRNMCCRAKQGDDALDRLYSEGSEWHDDSLFRSSTALSRVRNPPVEELLFHVIWDARGIAPIQSSRCVKMQMESHINI